MSENHLTLIISGIFKTIFPWRVSSIISDLEKAVSSLSGTCRHFVGTNAILRTFSVKYPGFFIEDGGRRVEDRDLRLEDGNRRIYN